jgi:hypothetical protein
MSADRVIPRRNAPKPQSSARTEVRQDYKTERITSGAPERKRERATSERSVRATLGLVREESRSRTVAKLTVGGNAAHSLPVNFKR